VTAVTADAPVETASGTSAAPTASAGPTRRRRVLILLICCMSLLVVGLDTTIVNVALPSIKTDLHASVSGLQWTIDAYGLVLGSLLMLGGSTADRFGRKRIFIAGLVLFTVGSLLCSLAPGLGWLIVFRMVQGAGGSMLNPVAMSIITNTFLEPKERAQAIGVWGSVVGFSIALGPVVGGVLIAAIGWRSVFWINIPVGLAAIALTLKFVPESRATHARRFDLVGQVLVIVLLAATTSAIIEAQRLGWGSAEDTGLFVLAVVALIGLITYERRRIEPLIDIRFFRSIPFSGAALTAVLAFSTFAGFLFVNTLYLQDVRGFSALRAGLCLLPLAVTVVIGAPLSGRMVGRGHVREPLVIAGCCMAIGTAILTQLRADTPMALIFVAYAIFGVGFGVVNAPITNTAVSGMPRAQAGVAAGIASTSRQTGNALGVAVIGLIATSGAGAELKGTLAQTSHRAWWVLMCVSLVVAAVGVLMTSARATRSASDTAQLLMADPVDRATARV
jgi:EmrB/QacA subfamily drug resistance transporter